MHNRALVAVSAAAAIAITGLVAPATTAGAVTTRPAAVREVAPFQKAGPVTISWVNPGDIDRVVVRLARGPKAPASTHDGRAIKLARPRASHAVITGLAPGRQYSAAVWTKRGGAFSRRSTTSFTTKFAPSTSPTPPGGGQTGRIAGTVVDRAGDPLSHAFVLLIDYSSFSHEYAAVTGSAGTFAIKVPEGQYFVGVFGSIAKGGTSDATGYLSSFRTTPVHTGQSALHFILGAGGALIGTVTDRTGAPLRHVQVGLDAVPAYLPPEAGGVDSFGDGPLAITRTDRNGRYRVTGLSPGAVVPCFATRGAFGGHTDARGYVATCGARSAGIAVRHVSTAAPVALATAPKVPATAFGKVAGKVTQSDGRPAGHVAVATESFREGVGITSRTDSRGLFHVSRLAPGRWRVCAGVYGSSRCTTATVTANHTAKVAIRLASRGALSGVLRAPSGTPIAAAEVFVDRAAPNSFEGFGTETDKHGAFTVSGLAAGKWRVCFGGGTTPKDPTGARSSCYPGTVQVVGGRDRIGIDETLAPGGAVAGTVTDNAGRPAGNVGVIVYRRTRHGSAGTSTTTDAHGDFTAVGLDPGDYRVCAELDYDTGGSTSKCVASQVTVTARHIAHSGRIELPADAPLTVTVSDGSADPLSGVDIAVLRRCGTSQYCTAQPVFDKSTGVHVASSGVTDQTGAVTFHGLQPGYYAACALAYYATSATAAVPGTGYADKCTGDTFALHVTRGGTAATGISLDPGGEVTGRVRDSAGSALSDVSMRVAGSAAYDYVPEFDFGDVGALGNDLFLLSPSPRQDARTSTDGRYTVRSVQAGSSKVCAVPPGALHVRRGCLSAPVTVTGATTTQAPTLTLMRKTAAQAARGQLGTARVVAATPTNFVRPARRFLPASERIPVISSTGMPEFRRTPQH